MREWLPSRPRYLQELLGMEQLPQQSYHCGSTENLLQCSNCFLSTVSCSTCFLHTHQYLPFHRVKRWNGQFFTASSLYAHGHIIYLGHGGKPCPNNLGDTMAAKDTFVDGLTLPGDDEIVEDILEEQDIDSENIDDPWVDQQLPETILVVVHTTGVFQQRVHWCSCPGCPKRHLQLFRMSLYPASIQRPKTVFTFDVLDHCAADMMECKTPAQSFFWKLRRLTNNRFPQKVPVSHCFACEMTDSSILTGLLPRTPAYISAVA